MIDTHCHLDLGAFDGDRPETLARARAAGVVGILVPAIRPRTWPQLLALGAAHGTGTGGGVRIALGVHPQIVPELDADERSLATDADRLLAAIAPHRAAIVAVGECGLDGGTAEPELQVAILRAHVRAARALALPLVIHVLRAHDVALRVLREERVRDIPSVLHSYSGGAALVPRYADEQLAFSFAGPVTYPGAKKPLAAARAVPAELLLAETDAPDQAPDAHRGRRNEPAHLVEVSAALARARAATPAAIAALTAANARSRFASWHD